ncbi:hypothetical protein [Streptomyces sp. NPDC047868]|uniref:hypothetical protein n=1 Tax=Streptomyces sp. NPDC047868 TaxID=3155480 RepID=UPI003452C1DD
MPGPTGPAGQDGADGAAGSDGQDGQDGSDGADGSDGQNGAPPSEWTYTDQDGNTYRCVPVDGFDPDNPRYQCTQTSTTSPEPDPSPSQEPEPSPQDGQSGLLPLGLLERRRN